MENHIVLERDHHYENHFPIQLFGAILTAIFFASLSYFTTNTQA